MTPNRCFLNHHLNGNLSWSLSWCSWRYSIIFDSSSICSRPSSKVISFCILPHQSLVTEIRRSIFGFFFFNFRDPENGNRERRLTNSVLSCEGINIFLHTVQSRSVHLSLWEHQSCAGFGLEPSLLADGGCLRCALCCRRFRCFTLLLDYLSAGRPVGGAQWDAALVGVCHQNAFPQPCMTFTPWRDISIR